MSFSVLVVSWFRVLSQNPNSSRQGIEGHIIVGCLGNADVQGPGRRGEHRDAAVPHRGQNREQLSVETASREIDPGRNPTVTPA